LTFAVYVGQIRIWCIFIARRYASAVYAVVVRPSVRCGCSIQAAERLDSSAVGIAQIVAHAARESIICRDGWRRGSSQMTVRTRYSSVTDAHIRTLSLISASLVRHKKEIIRDLSRVAAAAAAVASMH